MAGGLMAGTIAGAVGAIAMQKVMAGAQQTDVMAESGPEAVTGNLLDRAEANTDAATEDNVTDLGHLAFGAGAGALFGLTLKILPFPAMLVGPLFGRLVWETMYKGVAPAIGAMPTPDDDRPGRPETMQNAHLAYGGVLGTLVPLLRRVL
ncbi:MAG: hypothetical protein JWM18_5144 [Chloroflexi bacterium]|nr:hypothetical protein [Chloroflexota bacterium]